VIKVASYCRVSTERDDQANSFESQQRYFKEYISLQPDWELCQVYADEGITGTSTRKRTAFNRMIADARLGKFQLILTKEVSRFSRNILDTIAYTRELSALGVGILFMNDGISTLEPDAELRLSIMGSLAQEESRKTSARVKWGQTRRMEQGVVFGRSLLGYDVKNGRMTINPQGAELVRLIFHKYGVEKKGTTVIARELREAGFKTCRGNARWSNSHIIKILKNEKYVGDLVQKKTYTPDYLSHAKKYNHGEEAQVVIPNHHEGIISRELWDAVQRELNRRSPRGEPGAGHSNRYVFSGRIQCGECGASFVSRKRSRKDGTFYRRWSCYTAVSEGKAGCPIGKSLREETAMDLLRQSVASLGLDRTLLPQTLTRLVLEALQTEDDSRRPEALEGEMERIRQKKADVLDAFFSQQITREEMRLVSQKYDRELERLQTQLEAAQTTANADYHKKEFQEALSARIAALFKGETASESFYKHILDHITVHKNRTAEVRLSLLPHKWIYALGDQIDPAVPISVNSPLASAYGME